MRIISGSYPENSPINQTTGADVSDPSSVSALAVQPTNMQSVALQPAAVELTKLPEVDLERVAEIKAALGRGEINFNASKLAILIERYHTGR